MKRRVLVTGAAGRVAGIVMNATRDDFEFVCIDKRPAAHVPGLIVADLTDLAALERAAAGCDAMLHLGAHPNHHPDYPGVIVPSNIVGLHHAFEAAARAGLRRVVFASTVQTEWGWPEGTKVGVDMPARPRNYYSAAKVLGEHLGWLYHRDRGLSVVCLRLGGVILPHREIALLESGAIAEDIALFPGDLVEIVRRALTVEPLPYAVLPAYSRNAAAIKDLAPLKRVLDYEPFVDAKERLAAAKASPPPPPEPASSEAPAFRIPLIGAVYKNDEALVRKLLAEGADPNAQDPYGATALHIAAWHDRVALIRPLFAAGARVDARDGEHSATPRDWAEYAKKDAAVALLKELEDSPAAKAAALANAPTGAPAGWRSTAAADASFAELVESDVLGLWRALEAARAAKAVSFTFTPSSDPYGGWPAGTPIDPDTTPQRPANFRAAVDAMNAVIAETYGKRMGLNVMVDRIN